MKFTSVLSLLSVSAVFAFVVASPPPAAASANLLEKRSHKIITTCKKVSTYEIDHNDIAVGRLRRVLTNAFSVLRPLLPLFGLVSNDPSLTTIARFTYLDLIDTTVLDADTFELQKGDFALTFDDGPYTYGHSIARLLKEHNSLATFFINGRNWGCIYDYAEELQARYKEGFVFGSHTWNHVNLTQTSDAGIHEQLDLLEKATKKILGVKLKLFRPPYGEIDERAAKIIRSRGYTIITWDFDSGDSDGVLPKTSIAEYKALEYPTPHIALNHETYSWTAKTIMPKVVPMLLRKGYKLVTVSECLDIDPYHSVGKMGKRDKSWTCDHTPAPHPPTS